MRAGRRLRVVLHREGGHVQRPQPLDHVVVEADVADLDRAERPVSITTARPADASTRTEPAVAARPVDREAVVVAR